MAIYLNDVSFIHGHSFSSWPRWCKGSMGACGGLFDLCPSEGKNPWEKALRKAQSNASVSSLTEFESRSWPTI